MTKLTLKFWESTEINLVETEYIPPCRADAIRSVRGKSNGAFRGYGSFHWSPALKALCQLLLKYKVGNLSELLPLEQQILSGTKHSPAASLDYAISKEPVWLIEMFGSNSSGSPLSKRLFRRTNTNQKRPGPVSIAINENFLPAEQINIFVNDKQILSLKEL